MKMLLHLLTYLMCGSAAILGYIGLYQISNNKVRGGRFRALRYRLLLTFTVSAILIGLVIVGSVYLDNLI